MQDKSRMRRVCAHEAGHAVVALSLGLSIDGVEPTEDSFGTIVLAPHEPTPLEAFALAVVCMASVPAIKKDGHAMTHGHIDDFDKACYYLKHWHGDDTIHGKELLDLVAHAQRLATDIVERRWSDIDRVACLLEANNGTATEAQILAALRG